MSNFFFKKDQVININYFNKCLCFLNIYYPVAIRLSYFKFLNFKKFFNHNWLLNKIREDFVKKLVIILKFVVLRLYIYIFQFNKKINIVLKGFFKFLYLKLKKFKYKSNYLLKIFKYCIYFNKYFQLHKKKTLNFFMTYTNFSTFNINRLKKIKNPLITFLNQKQKFRFNSVFFFYKLIRRWSLRRKYKKKKLLKYKKKKPLFLKKKTKVISRVGRVVKGADGSILSKKRYEVLLNCIRARQKQKFFKIFKLRLKKLKKQNGGFLSKRVFSYFGQKYLRKKKKYRFFRKILPFIISIPRSKRLRFQKHDHKLSKFDYKKVIRFFYNRVDRLKMWRISRKIKHLLGGGSFELFYRQFEGQVGCLIFRAGFTRNINESKLFIKHKTIEVNGRGTSNFALVINHFDLVGVNSCIRYKFQLLFLNRLINSNSFFDPYILCIPRYIELDCRLMVFCYIPHYFKPSAIPFTFKFKIQRFLNWGKFHIFKEHGR